MAWSVSVVDFLEISSLNLNTVMSVLSSQPRLPARVGIRLFANPRFNVDGRNGAGAVKPVQQQFAGEVG